MKRRMSIVVTAALLVLAAACGTSGDDEADEKKDEPTSTTTSTTDPEEAAPEDDEEAGGEGDGSNPDYCAAVVDLDELVVGLDDNDVQGFATAVAGGGAVIDRYIETTPEDLKDEAELEMAAFRAWAEKVGALSPDDPEIQTRIEDTYAEAFTPEAQAASDATTEYLEATCPE